MVDYAYRLPDGSIKSFPDTKSEDEIRRFVSKTFPGRPSAMWLSGPLSQHRVRKFDDGTLETMTKLYDVAKPYADSLGVDPYLAIGGPAEELDTIHRMTPLSRAGNWALDWKARHWDSKEGIREDLEEAKNVDQSTGVSVWSKPRHPVLTDLGLGNFKLAHAIDLLRRYNQRFPDSDPLQLKKKYNFNYEALGRDLADWDNLEAPAKFAVLDAADAVAFFERSAPQTWANADKFKKLGLVSTYYNRGRERMVQDAHEDRSLGGYEPVPSFGGEWSTENGPALSEMIDAQHRTKSEMDFAQRRAKSVSSALPFGKFAYDRAGHPTAYETNASDALSEEGSLPRSFRPPFALVDAIQANRPGQYLSGFDFTGGYAPIGTPRYSGARYSGGMNDVGTSWGLDAPSERLANARVNAGAGIDPTMTNQSPPAGRVSVCRGRRQSALPTRSPPTPYCFGRCSVDSARHARLLVYRAVRLPAVAAVWIRSPSPG
jgi:hypothetical protein